MTCCPHHLVDRRTFLKFAVGGTAAACFLPRHALWARPELLLGGGPAKAKAVIILWMSGGPSQLDTFDPKPGTKTGGQFRAVPAARGMEISEHLPRLAKQGTHLSIIRSMTTDEAAHERGAYLMHTGYAPIQGLEFAPTGTVVSREIGKEDFALPTFIALQAGEVPLSHVFGERHMPFTVDDLNNPLPNIRSLVRDERDSERTRLLEKQDKGFDAERDQAEIAKAKEAQDKAQDLMTTPLLKAFDLKEESEELRKKYGAGFGEKCLLARRLVEAGVPCVEVGLGGWDNHNNVFNAVKDLSGYLDAGFGTLVEDLAGKDMLKETLVVWMGEFGRTPQINPGNGRDHWPNGFSVVLAGGGIQGGRVIGSTGKEGMEVEKRPVTTPDLFATIYECLGVDPKTEYEVQTRVVSYAAGGRAVRELF